MSGNEQFNGMSKAQQEARVRAWQIYQLRGMCTQVRKLYFAGVMTPDDVIQVQDIVDGALKRLNAETETERSARYRQGLENL